MAKETRASELKRLRKEQDKTLRDEVFGGLSPVERAEYDVKSDRINKLEIEISATEAADKSAKAAKARQELEWNKPEETDIPKAEARQPNRRREKDSGNRSTAGPEKSSAKKTHKSE